MGRVQDAMRRAAAQAHGEAAPEIAAQDPSPVESRPAEETVALPVPDVTNVDADTFRTAEAEPAPEPAPAVNGQPTLVLKHIDAKYASKVVVDQTMLASSREQYRRLAAALHHAHEGSGMSVVMIASAVAGEGKSLTASNLALTLSESYKRSVLLIDGDLRRPSLHRLFGFTAERGLSEALLAVDEPELTLVQVSDRLTVLPGGRPNSDPMAGLIGGRMQRLIREARELFDWVLIDTPPVGLLSDANLLGAMVDATLLVIRADRTPFPLVQRAIDAIGRDRILGTVLNQSTVQARGAYYEYYHYYQAPRGELSHG